MIILTDGNDNFEPISNAMGAPRKLSLSAYPGEAPAEKPHPTNEDLMRAIVALDNKVAAFGKLSELMNQILAQVKFLRKCLK